MAPHPIKFIAIGALFVIGIISIVAVATDYWYETNYNHGGLWRNCLKHVSICAKLDDDQVAGKGTLNPNVEVARGS